MRPFCLGDCRDSKRIPTRHLTYFHLFCFVAEFLIKRLWLVGSLLFPIVAEWGLSWNVCHFVKWKSAFVWIVRIPMQGWVLLHERSWENFIVCTSKHRIISKTTWNILGSLCKSKSDYFLSVSFLWNLLQNILVVPDPTLRHFCAFCAVYRPIKKLLVQLLILRNQLQFKPL